MIPVVMGLTWDCHLHATVWCIAIAMVLPWDIAMVLPWDIAMHGIGNPACDKGNTMHACTLLWEYYTYDTEAMRKLWTILDWC